MCTNTQGVSSVEQCVTKGRYIGGDGGGGKERYGGGGRAGERVGGVVGPAHLGHATGRRPVLHLAPLLLQDIRGGGRGGRGVAGDLLGDAATPMSLLVQGGHTHTSHKSSLHCDRLVRQSREWFIKPVHNTCRRAGHRTPHTCLGVPQAPLLQPRQQQHPGKQLSYTARRKGSIVAPAHGLGRCDIGGHLNTLTSLHGLHSVPHDLTHVQAESVADTPKQSMDPDVTLQLEEQHRNLSTHADYRAETDRHKQCYYFLVQAFRTPARTDQKCSLCFYTCGFERESTFQ